MFYDGLWIILLTFLGGKKKQHWQGAGWNRGESKGEGWTSTKIFLSDYSIFINGE